MEYGNDFRNPLDIDGAISEYRPGYLVPRIKMPCDEDEQTFKQSSSTKRKIRAIALEGTHGVGKSTMCKVLRLLGYHVIEEDFIDVFSNFIVPGNPSHNCLVEIAWASMQIINLMNMANNIRRELVMDPTAHDVFFMDRCFMTGYVYGVMDEKTRKYYMRLFKNAIDDLKSDYNIDFEIIRLKAADVDAHFAHIQSRLSEDKTGVREELHEAEREHFDKIEEEYDTLEYIEGMFNHVFIVNFKELENGDIVLPMGEFFETLGIKGMAAPYSDIDLTYSPKEDCLTGIKPHRK